MYTILTTNKFRVYKLNVDYIKKKLEKIDIDGVISSGTIKNLIEKELDK